MAYDGFNGEVKVFAVFAEGDTIPMEKAVIVKMTVFEILIFMGFCSKAKILQSGFSLNK